MTTKGVSDEIRGLRTMSAALRWAAGRVPPARFLEAVAQDEFTFDVIVEVTPDLFLVFDTT